MAAARRLTRAEQQAQTRARLIDAAAKVFARRGFQAASVEEIAEEAGYSHGAVYSNFEGKADLFLAVFEDYMAERVRELAETQAALPADAPLEVRARALADQWMDRLARDRESLVLHIEFIAHADRDPELARRFGTRSAAMREAVARYISHYQQEAGAELAMPVDDLALVLRALGIGLAIESLVSPDAVRHDLYGDFVELLVSLMREGRSEEAAPPPRERKAVSAPAYDRIGLSYSEVRRADPRFEAAIRRALGDANSVLNIGAGAGSYEPSDREVIAVEPSPVMIAQRPAEAAPAIQGAAESLPLEDKSVDATMGVFTMQHWDDVDRGLAEVLRVTRERIVFLTLDLDVTAEMWLCRDYLPEIIEHDRETFPTIAHLQDVLPGLQVDTVLVPGDCTDGFCVALWSRPEAHLDPTVRRASSIWHLLPPATMDSGLDRLHQDLETGEWDRRYGQLRTQAALDVGVRLVKVEL